MVKKKEPDWNKIRIEYETTDISQSKLAKKYKVSRNTIASRAVKGDWARNKKEIAAEIQRKSTERIKTSIIEQKVEANTRHIELINEGMDVISELLNIYKEELAKKKFKKANAKNIDFLMSALVKAQKGQRLALNIDNETGEDSEPEINVIKGLDIGKI